MKNIFDSNIFDRVIVKNQDEFELFCAKYPDFSRSYLKAGVVSDLRNEYEEIFSRFSMNFPVKGFTEEIRISDEKFTQRIWELEIFNALDSLGGEILRLSMGYDFSFKSNNILVNIECVAPELGKYSSSMRISNSNSVQMAPPDIGDIIVLRIANSLVKKYLHKNQAPKGVNPYIMAINSANLGWDWDLIWIYRVLFALQYPKSNNLERQWILRGAELGFFTSSKFENISAIIFSNNHPNEFRYGNPNNISIFMVHNPFALNPIDHALFKGFSHVEFNPDTLEINDGIYDPDDVPLGTIINIA